MLNFKLIELESELLAKKLSSQVVMLSPQCEILLNAIEQEIGLRLADRCFKDWSGWLSYLKTERRTELRVRLSRLLFPK